MEKEPKREWYDNQQLFEMFSKKVEELTKEMDATKERLHDYNGLHDRFDNVEGKLKDVEGKVIAQVQRCDKVQSRMEGKEDSAAKFIKIWPLVVMTIMMVFTIWISLS